MKEDDWTKILIYPILSWIIASITVFLALVINKMNLYYFRLILIIPPVILIGFLFYARKYHSDPDTDLEFYSYFEPRGHTVKLDKGDRFQLVWEFKNNLKKEIKVLSYNIRINLNGKVFQDHNWRDNYTPIIPPGPLSKKWDEKGKSGYNIENSGKYEFQSIIEYQLPNGEKKLTHHTSPLTIVGKGEIINR